MNLQLEGPCEARSDLMKSLGAWRLGERSLRRLDDDGGTALGFTAPLEGGVDAAADYARRLRSTENDHLLPPVRWGLVDGGELWVECEHLGRADSVQPMSELLYQKGGRLQEMECRYAADQLVRALSSAHEAGLSSGRLDADMLLVDQHGRVLIELFGSEVLSGVEDRSLEERRQADLAALVDLLFHLATGVAIAGRESVRDSLLAEAPRIWQEWFARSWGASAGVRSLQSRQAALPS